MIEAVRDDLLVELHPQAGELVPQDGNLSLELGKPCACVIEVFALTLQLIEPRVE